MSESPRPADPNYILSQEEFHNSINPIFRTLDDTQGQISRAFREAEMAFGWIVLSLAFWLFLLGYYALKGQVLKP